ncbi:LURP-one-related family protein [Halosquirtibacter xylanolyticus]|uniref:LURP-one-related/scramblase family protein n=1 Tax=Halosquirtibacter xylanolyticus TaxID=3374599 RepID=UPI00374A7601|nr:LURP-one-related family protein [Prolixibacteraceae bacterium]
MNPILNKNNFFVKEHTGMFKASNNYDIYDPESDQMLIECREINLGWFAKILRFNKDYKRMTPFEIVLTDANGQKVLTVKRKWTFWRSEVEVLDHNDQIVGKLKQKLLSIGGKFRVYDTDDNEVCMVKGKWTSWEFSFLKEDVQLAQVSKKWAGLAKELFTSADTYMLTIDPRVAENSAERVLIMASVMCIDMVLKE